MSTDNKKRSEVVETSDSGSVAVYLFMALVGLALLILAPSQIQWVDTNRGWYLQPRFASGIGLSIFVLFACIQVFQLRHQLNTEGFNPLERLVDFIGGYRTALMASLLFLVYLSTLSVLGFFISTLLFITTLLWLSRLLDRFWFLMTFCMVIMLVLIFRVGVNLWLPDVWLYEFLPEALADFANQYL